VKWCLVLVIFGSVFSAAAAAVPCRLKLKDGTLLEGRVTIDPKSGLVLTNGTVGQTNLSLSAINSARFNADATAAASTVSSNATGPLPGGWTNQDIGPVAIPGSVKLENGRFTISSSGTRIWLQQPDEFHFVYRSFTGNGQLIAQITNMEAAIAGIMFRQTLEPNSEFVMEAATLANDGMIFRTRRDPRHRELVRSEGDWQNRDEVRPPCWLKLTRREKRFTAYESLDDGISWQAVYESPNEWGRTIFAGLLVAGGSSNTLKSASFANVLIEDETDTMNAQSNKLFNVEAVLTDGSILHARSVTADESKIRIGFAKTNYVVSIYSVSRLVYRPVPDRLKGELASGRKGVLLKNGDFFEGELRSADRNQVKLSSILFGTRSFPTDRVTAVVLAESSERPASYRLRTLDGSLIRAKSLAPGSDSVVADELRLGALAIPLDDLLEIETIRK